MEGLQGKETCECDQVLLSDTNEYDWLCAASLCYRSIYFPDGDGGNDGQVDDMTYNYGDTDNNDHHGNSVISQGEHKHKDNKKTWDFPYHFNVGN